VGIRSIIHIEIRRAVSRGLGTDGSVGDSRPALSAVARDRRDDPRRLNWKTTMELSIGDNPYSPLLFLGLPKAILPVAIGVPMGLMGAGVALFRHGDISKAAGFALVGGAIAAWILIVSRIID